MLFKDLKVGDTIYVKNPNQWDKPIKKTIGKIVPDGIWLKFYTTEGGFIGDGIAKRSQCYSGGIFADFESFKKFWINHHTRNVERIQVEKQEIIKALVSAVDDLVIARHMEEED